LAAGNPQSLLTPDDVAAYLRVSKKSVYRLVSSDALPAVRIGGLLRFNRDAVRRYVETQRDRRRGPDQGPK
jgi:excisionase family DNA binding protein